MFAKLGNSVLLAYMAAGAGMCIYIAAVIAAGIIGM